MVDCYNGMPCEGECSKRPAEERQYLEDFYVYNFERCRFECNECGNIFKNAELKEVTGNSSPQ